MAADRAVVQTAVMDSTRWDRFVHRPGDIFVCTPPKCGTTWTQAIVASLLWPAGDVPGPVMDLAPWWDANFYPVEELAARLEARTFRRAIKTHLPADAIPWFDTGFYIAVFRDGRDAFMSYVNHLASFRDDVRDRLNAAAAAQGLQPMPKYGGGHFERNFVGGGESFLHKGTNGRWRDVLTEDELARYDVAVAKLLSEEMAAWLDRGSLAAGWRPEPPREAGFERA